MNHLLNECTLCQFTQQTIFIFSVDELVLTDIIPTYNDLRFKILYNIEHKKPDSKRTFSTCMAKFDYGCHEWNVVSYK